MPLDPMPTRDRSRPWKIPPTSNAPPWASLAASRSWRGRTRFRDEALAGEAVNFVLDGLSADGWRRVRAHRGPARLETYLTTVAAHLLEDFARRRFGRARVPDWVMARGPLWEHVYRLLCLERQPLAAALDVVVATAPGGRDPTLAQEAARAIRARYPRCGGSGPGEVPLEDLDLATDPTRDPRTPEDLALDAERAALLIALGLQLLGIEAAGEALDPTDREPPPRLSPIDLSPEDRLLLHLIYSDGLKVTAAGGLLGLGVNQAHGKHRRLMQRLRAWLEGAGLAATPGGPQ